jgi:HAD superfamily hydrolase (TIGR01549 family)
MITAKVALFDLGNTLFYDRPSDWPRIYRRAEAALWRALRRGGVRIAAANLYKGHNTLLSYYYALRGEGIEEPGTLRVLSELLRNQNISVPQATAEKSLRAMYSVTQTNWRVEHDAAATLRTLLKRGYRLGAVSNGSDHRNALELLDKARMRSFFEFVITSEAHGRRKPAASIFQAALAFFHVEGPLAVMIGDSYEADVLGALALGMPTIWFIKHAAALGIEPALRPDATIRKLSEILALLS